MDLNFNEGPKPSDWQALQAYYVLKTKYNNHQISINLFAANTEEIKSIENVELTGDLSKDRRQIHQIADGIYKQLFNLEGIATTRILYTVKNENGVNAESEVWEADYDGKNSRQLTFHSGYSIMPTYIPPKAGYAAGAFLFVSYKTGQPKIFYQSLNQKKPLRLNYLRGNQLMPAISRQQEC